MSLLYNYLPPRILVQSRARGCAVLTLQQIILDVLNKSEKIQHLTYSMNSVCHHTHTHTLSLSLSLSTRCTHAHRREISLLAARGPPQHTGLSGQLAHKLHPRLFRGPLLVPRLMKSHRSLRSLLIHADRAAAEPRRASEPSARHPIVTTTSSSCTSHHPLLR
jgi:hypothetical protein